MVVAMRLMRMGNKHRPVYRISVADSRRAPTGKFLEHIGTYDPHLDKMGNKMLRLNVARAKYWIAMGCQPSTVVARLLSRFHLLPITPQRQQAVVDPLVLKVLAGEDVRAELDAQAHPPPNEENGVLVHPPSLSNRRHQELTPKRMEQLKKQAPWKLQSFPFDYQPTSNTMAAWKQARLFHGVDDVLREQWAQSDMEFEEAQEQKERAEMMANETEEEKAERELEEREVALAEEALDADVGDALAEGEEVLNVELEEDVDEDEDGEEDGISDQEGDDAEAIEVEEDISKEDLDEEVEDQPTTSSSSDQPPSKQ